MSQLKSRLERIESKMKKPNSYGEIIHKHSIETRKRCGPDEGMLIHTVMALYINSHPEHKGAIKARNYLEWMHNQSFNAIKQAYSAIKDLVAAGLATFTPAAFFSDGRDASRIIPPYPYLCNPEQILHYSDEKDTQFWLD